MALGVELVRGLGVLPGPERTTVMSQVKEISPGRWDVLGEGICCTWYVRVYIIPGHYVDKPCLSFELAVALLRRCLANGQVTCLAGDFRVREGWTRVEINNWRRLVQPSDDDMRELFKSVAEKSASAATFEPSEEGLRVLLAAYFEMGCRFGVSVERGETEIP